MLNQNQQSTKISPLSRVEHGNAVCAICRLPSRIAPKMEAATHEVVSTIARYFACDGHAKRAAAWARCVEAGGVRP